MDRTERFYKIDQMIRERRVVSFAALQDALEVSRATLKRDLEYLRSRMNAPIVWDREAGGYRFESADGKTVPTYELPGLWFNASEVYALLTMQHLLADLDTGGILAPHIAPLEDRLNALLGSADNAAAEVRRRVLIVGLARRRITLAYFERIGHALVQRKRLRIEYFARGSGELTLRDVSPQRLVHYRENWYLDAWCHLRNDLRNFALDAIREASVLDIRAKDVSARSVDTTLGPGYGIIADGRPRLARLRFSAARARWVAHESWHPAQRGHAERDGRYLLEFPYTDDRELVMDILRHGAEVEVLAPAALRKRVVDELARLQALYA